jgi:hypothetical protein
MNRAPRQVPAPPDVAFFFWVNQGHCRALETICPLNSGPLAVTTLIIMGWLKTTVKTPAEAALTERFALRLICDSHLNSWGSPCSDTSTAIVVAQSWEACFTSAEQMGWSFDSHQLPSEEETGTALCPNCTDLLGRADDLRP